MVSRRGAIQAWFRPSRGYFDGVTGTGDRHLPWFGLDIEHERGVIVATVRGEVDIDESVEILRVATQAAVPVVVDLSHCEYIGAVGLQALLQGRRAARQREHRFVVVHDGRADIVGRLFEAVDADRLFPIRPTREEAVAEASRWESRSEVDRRLPVG